MRKSIVGLLLCVLFAARVDAASSEGSLAPYILRAVHMLGEQRGGKGYGRGSFTQDLKFGDSGSLVASQAPYTMCVAAQLEVLIEALNLYSQETRDFSPFKFIPKPTWEMLRPIDLRGQIWIVRRSPSTGAAHAFENFGMGKRVPFRDLKPGDFLNFNRTNKTGHGVVFLGFLDASGAELQLFSEKVAGFKYFSAQGAGKSDGGLGYRWAFFSDVPCPTLTADRKRDCGVVRSERNALLVGGYVKLPKFWDQNKASGQILSGQAATDPALSREGRFNAKFFTGITTDD